MIKLRIIGDVHGKIPAYIKLAEEAENSIQLGDLGFDYSGINCLNPKNHRVLGGNHDNYEYDGKNFILQTDHFLGDFGTHSVPDIGDFFFVRGASSIDKKNRTHGIDWWPHEEMEYRTMMFAFEEYSKVKPKIVLSHECPIFIIEMISGYKTWDGMPIFPSMTAKLLESMFDEHKPELWIFGHHHKHFDMSIEGTRFICLPELACFDFKDDK